MTIESARTKAKAALEAVKENRDPVQEEVVRIEGEGKKRANTRALASDGFLRLYPRCKALTRAEVKRLLHREIVMTLGDRRVSSITRRDITRVINIVSDRGAGTMANRLLAYLGAFFSWIVKRGDLDATPIMNLVKPSEERAQDRVLTDEELRAVWLGADLMAYPFGRVVQLLIFVGQRRDEVAGMRRSDLDLKAGLWTLAREQTKSDRRHEVPLSQLAREVLKCVPTAGDLLFPASTIRTRKGKMGDAKEEPRHISEWSSIKETLNEKGLAAWVALVERAAVESGSVPKTVTLSPDTLHELRRTVASGMARLRMAPHVMEKLLNHSTGTKWGVAAVYNRHNYAPEMQHAVDLWAAHVSGLISPVPSDVVVLNQGTA